MLSHNAQCQTRHSILAQTRHNTCQAQWWRNDDWGLFLNKVFKSQRMSEKEQNFLKVCLQATESCGILTFYRTVVFNKALNDSLSPLIPRAVIAT